MSSYKIKIPYNPKAKASIKNNRWSHYNPSALGMKRTKEYVKGVVEQEGYPLLEGPLLVIVHFVFPAPLSSPEWKRRKQNGKVHAQKPDGDNLEKFLNDSLNGVVWKDDSRICWLLRSKTFTGAKEGYTLVYARELENEYCDYDFILNEIQENIEVYE